MITEVFLPQLTSTMEEGTIVNWLKEEGEAVAAEEPLLEVETDKAIMEIEAPAAGLVLKLLAEPGDTCPVLAPLALIGEAGDDVSAYQAPAREAPLPGTSLTPSGPSRQRAVPTTPAGAGGRGAASPRARRLAEELGVDLGAVTGTGPEGRIVEEDVRRAAEAAPALTPAAGPGEIIPLAGMRKAVAANMAKSKREIPHFYLTSQVDMTAASALLAELKPRFREQGVKLTYTALLAKATALALAEVPELNAWCTEQGIQRLPEVNLGVAVAARQGLLVPVLRRADRLGLLEAARSLQDLAERARSGVFPADAFRDRSFTLSNLGGFPVDQFAAIINPPEVGILAMGRVRDTAVAYQGEAQIRPQLNLTLSCDHRAVDGVVAAGFLQRLGESLQTPEALV
jgi:pyruvate dehydrogenase E2 component (dihydrolipoamide acetyltransferase)